MSALRRERQAAREAGSPRRCAFRILEAALWAVVGLLFLWRVAPQVQAAVGWRTSGSDAPAVTFQMLDGGSRSLSDLRGQVVLVNFWASWCPPCRAEMPGFQKVYDAKRAAGFTVVGVSLDEGSRERVTTFLRDHGITYPVALGTQQAVAAFGGIDNLPTSFLIDRRGRVRYTVHGMFLGLTLGAAVDKLLAEKG